MRGTTHEMIQDYNSRMVASNISQRDKLTNAFNSATSLIKNPIIGGAVNLAGKLIYRSGLADKITGGKATKILKGFVNLFSPEKEQKQDLASVVRESMGTTGTEQLAKMLKQ